MPDQLPQNPPPQPLAPQQTSAAKPTAAPLPKDQGKSNRKLVIGCVSAFGCSLLLFIGVLFAFLAFGSTENPIFGFFGVPPSQVVNVLITLVNLIFLVLVFISFIFVVVGVFKITTAKKDDKEAKRKGMFFTFGAFSILVLLVVFWIFAYFFLASKRTVTVRTPITTQPEKTINLTAPVTVAFTAGQSTINTRLFDVLSYTWDFADGTSLSGNPQTHTFTDIGNFKVALTITAKERATAKEQKFEFTRDVTIANVKAKVIIKAEPSSGTAPLTVQLDGSESSSTNGEITAYEWDLDEDGQFDDASTPQTEKIFPKIGTYKVSLRVKDSTGDFSTGDTTIEAKVPDTPVAVISLDSVDGKEGVDGMEMEIGRSYAFSGAQSVSPTGTIEKYSWDFGDGGKAGTRTANHIYKNAGEYDVTLKVTDSSKKEGSATLHLAIGTPAATPLPSIKTTPELKNGILSGQAPFNVIFDGSGSQDSNNNIVDYAWDFDGDSKTDDTNAVTSHTFTTAGNYNASLTVTDSTELFGTSQVVINVSAAGLKADIVADPIAGTSPLTVQFDASGSSYPEGRIVSYEWDFGDGSAPRIDTAKVAHQYTAIGTFTAKVTAITSDNKRASTQIPINVRPISVKACFEPSTSSGKSPLEVEFDPTCSTGTVVKYRWNFAGLGQSTDRKPHFTFMDPGTYTISLEVADSQNVVDKFTSVINATNL